jgi:hypothetical protein
MYTMFHIQLVLSVKKNGRKTCIGRLIVTPGPHIGDPALQVLLSSQKKWGHPRQQQA